MSSFDYISFVSRLNVNHDSSQSNSISVIIGGFDVMTHPALRANTNAQVWSWTAPEIIG